MADTSFASLAAPGSIALFVVAALLGIATGVHLRVRRRPAADLRARRLRAEHDLARLRRARRGRRRVRDPAARGHPVRGDLAEAAAGDPRRRGLRVRAALRPQHPAHRRHARQGHHRSPDARRRQHADAAARAQAVPRPTTRRRSARSRKRSSRSRSRSGTRSARSSRSTATRCTSATASTASRPPRGSTSASPPRT